MVMHLSTPFLPPVVTFSPMSVSFKLRPCGVHHLREGVRTEKVQEKFGASEARTGSLWKIKRFI